MQILVAPDKFKGSLSAVAAVEAITRGLHAVWPDAEISAAPIADGGEGFAEALCQALGGEWVETRALDPIGRECRRPCEMATRTPGSDARAKCRARIMFVRNRPVRPGDSLHHCDAYHPAGGTAQVHRVMWTSASTRDRILARVFPGDRAFHDGPGVSRWSART